MTVPELYLGLECGGTRTVALVADGQGQLVARVEGGPCNLRLVSDAELEERFRDLAGKLPAPVAVGIGMAGVRDATDCARIERILEKVWPGLPRLADHDLESAWMTVEDDTGSESEPRVVVLSGTGSCCYGRDSHGHIAKVGGWGHLLGDRGSAYDIAFRALRTAAHEYDHTEVWGPFGQRALRELQLNEPNDLIAWLQSASKTAVAALAPQVFAAAAEGDSGARRVLKDTADILARDALACARRLVKGRGPVQFILAGSVLLKQPGLVRAVARQIRAERPGSRVVPLPRESVWGAVAMARAARRGRPGSVVASASEKPAQRELRPTGLVPATRELSPTEQRNPRSMELDRLPLGEAIELMLTEDAGILEAIRAHRSALERLIQRSVRTFRAGGRLFYVGAGTSGRLGVLDASECPPTFRTPPEWVQGIMAGGEKALHSAVEGAEDDPEAGSRAVQFRGVGPKDLVVGIAASGRTPFVWGALAEARRRGAVTGLICFNPHLVFARGQKPDHVLAVDVGPEVLTGSTRLKAGTATKLILNLLTTLTFVRLGKVVGNLMVDLNPSNVKLRDRACRIVMELTHLDRPRAEAELARAKWSVGEVVRRFRRA
ncbi:MAG: N-acetylmuramic acid 6-phosphate etherase [Verrucomicrobia bacterium]|nr:N-acetylmuramic acid 6-phosphate etherase [Verrucomicrobiota bacterium]